MEPSFASIAAGAAAYNTGRYSEAIPLYESAAAAFESSSEFQEGSFIMMCNQLAICCEAGEMF